MGAQLVKEVASKTSDVAGDGTTTATLLTEAIFKAGLRAVTAGAAPVVVNKGFAGRRAARSPRPSTKLSKPVKGIQRDPPDRDGSPPTTTSPSAS